MFINTSRSKKPSDGTRKVKRDLVVQADVIDGDVASPITVRWMRCGRKTVSGRL